MITPVSLITARNCGEIRYAVAYETTGAISCLLDKFVLTTDESLLIEHDRDTALEILISLLWKDMAYGHECMPRHEAVLLAEEIFSEYEQTGCRYFSNANLAQGESWNPLTESTFDSGLIIINPSSNIHLCIWFQDED